MFGRLVRMFRSILMLQDTAHAIALGTAIGLFVAWTPTVGLHLVLVGALSLLLRANKVAGLIAVWISNPFTVLPMYWIDYWLGATVLNENLTYEQLRAILDSGFKTALWRLCVELAGPMWLGGLVLALAHAIPGYYLTRWAVDRFRRRHPQGVPGCSDRPEATAAAESRPLSSEPSSIE